MATHELDHAALARRLRGAYANGAVAPLRDGLDPLDGAGAYAVRAVTVAGRRPGGHDAPVRSAPSRGEKDDRRE